MGSAFDKFKSASQIIQVDPMEIDFPEDDPSAETSEQPEPMQHHGHKQRPMAMQPTAHLAEFKLPESPGASALRALMNGSKEGEQAPEDNREWGSIGQPAKHDPRDQEHVDAEEYKNPLLASMFRRKEGNKTLWHLEENAKQIAFAESCNELTFCSVDHTGVPKDALRLGLLLAIERGWNPPHIDGTEEFRRKAFLEAARLGIPVTGYAPSQADLGLLKREGVKVTVPAINPITPTPQKNPALEC